MEVAPPYKLITLLTLLVSTAHTSYTALWASEQKNEINPLIKSIFDYSGLLVNNCKKKSRKKMEKLC